jgi:hypothetical protein
MEIVMNVGDFPRLENKIGEHRNQKQSNNSLPLAEGIIQQAAGIKSLKNKILNKVSVFKNVKNKINEKIFPSKLKTEDIKQEKSRKIEPSTVKDITLDHLKNLREQPEEHQSLDFYQICGQEIGYGDWKVGEIVDAGQNMGTYKIDKIITNEKGLHITVLIPQEEGHPPVLCCRGTVNNLHNIIDDMGKVIGLYGFEPSEEEILETLRKLAIDHGPAVITGHSLGGALAQVIAAKLGDYTITRSSDGQEVSLVKEIYHYNAPGIGKKMKNAYMSVCSRLQADGVVCPKIFSFRHVNDVVSLTGSDHLPADTHYDLGKMQVLANPIKVQIYAHSYFEMMSVYHSQQQVSVRDVSKKRDLSQRVFKQLLEPPRKGVGRIAKKALTPIAAQ